MPLPNIAFGLAVTLTFDLLTSKSDQFNMVFPNCSEVVNLAKFQQTVKDIVLKQTFFRIIYDYARTHPGTHTHTHTLSRTARKQNACDG